MKKGKERRLGSWCAKSFAIAYATAGPTVLLYKDSNRVRISACSCRLEVLCTL